MFKYLFNPQNHPFNRASKLFGQLRYLEQSGQEYWRTIIEIIKLCWEAIKINKYDGDAHVMLANAYLLAAFRAFQELKSEGYVYYMSRCAAVIYEWKTNPRMYSKEKEQGEKIYREIINRLKGPLPDWMDRDLPKDIRKLHNDFYMKAKEEEIRQSLDGTEQRFLSQSGAKDQPENIYNDNAIAHSLRSGYYRDQGNMDESIRQLQLGLLENPDNPSLHVLLGCLYGELGRYDESILELQTALRLDPKINDVYIPLATAFFHQNQLDKAISEFQIGLSIKPNDSDARFLLARSYYKQGRLQDALREYKILAQTDPKQAVAHMIHYAMGESYSELGQLDDAIREFRASLSIEANIGATHFYLGKCYERQDQKDMAIREFRIAAELGYQDE